MLPRRQPGLLLTSLLNIFLIKSHPKMLAKESNGIGLSNASAKTYVYTSMYSRGTCRAMRSTMLCGEDAGDRLPVP
jgi:hypothetical protein